MASATNAMDGHWMKSLRCTMQLEEYSARRGCFNMESIKSITDRYHWRTQEDIDMAFMEEVEASNINRGD